MSSHTASTAASDAAPRDRRLLLPVVLPLVAALVATAAVFIIPAPRGELPVLAKLPPFNLVDQDGESFGRGDLAGDPFIASFFFTSCPTVCPRLMARVSLVQQRLDAAGDDVRLVSFSVDPETDTPPVLRDYARRWEADHDRWTFLTGDVAAVERTVVKGFMLPMDKVNEANAHLGGHTTGQVFHGERLVLVDGHGRVRGFYETDDAGLDELLEHARRL